MRTGKTGTLSALVLPARMVPRMRHGAVRQRAAQPGSHHQQPARTRPPPTPSRLLVSGERLPKWVSRRKAIVCSATPRDWNKGDLPEVLVFGSADTEKDYSTPRKTDQPGQRAPSPSPSSASQSVPPNGRRRSQGGGYTKVGASSGKRPYGEERDISPPSRAQQRITEGNIRETADARVWGAQQRDLEGGQSGAPGTSEVDEALSRFNAAVTGQKASGVARGQGKEKSRTTTDRPKKAPGVQELTNLTYVSGRAFGKSASPAGEQDDVYSALSRFKAAAARSSRTAPPVNRPPARARRRDSGPFDPRVSRPRQQRKGRREADQSLSGTSGKQRPEAKGQELGWGSFDAESWDMDDERDWSAGGRAQLLGWDGEIEADTSPRYANRSQSSDYDNFQDSGPSAEKAGGKQPKGNRKEKRPLVELLSAEEAQRIMPQAPLPGQVSYYRGDIVQTVGLSFTLLVLGSAFTQTTPLAIGAATYPFWGPIGQAAVRNLRVGRYRCCGLWRATVIEVAIEQGLGRAADRRGNRRRGVSLAVITLGDMSGARTRVEIETAAPVSILRTGMPVEAIVMSGEETFERFKVVRELYLPEVNFWLSDYPFYNQREFLRLRSVLSRDESVDRDQNAGSRRYYE